jgi:site-specific DNA-methyltransferase (adenine-specific)
MKGQDALFSSDFHGYSTPSELFEWANKRFNFTVDVCADKSNHKCSKYYTEESNGLLQSWRDEVAWCNPPYNRTKLWILKGINEIKNNDCETVVYLIPARVETKLWQEVIAPDASKIIFLKGRLKFSGNRNSAPFPSALVIFTQPWNDTYKTKVEFLDYKSGDIIE